MTNGSNNKKRVIKQYNGSAHQFAEAVDFEKTSIIAPSLKKAFNRAVRDEQFDIEKHKVIDVGCGPFLLSLPFLREGIHVDGVDITPAMIKEAKNTLRQAEGEEINRIKPKIKLTDDYESLKKHSYKFGMLNFVHQCSDTETALAELFKKANDLLAEDSTLVLMTTHPDYLHIPHAAYACDVQDSKALRDGDSFGGTIFTNRGRKAFNLKDDYYWSTQTLQRIARETGFEVRNIEEIEDHSSLARKKSEQPAYLMMTFHKPQTQNTPIAANQSNANSAPQAPAA